DSIYNKLVLPETYFKKLFDTFNEYNFTIYEDAPDEHTVAVDPEMLGHIFENLLEDNKDKGAFYTPKDIVHYMCRESLHNYIYTYTGNEDNNDFKTKLKVYNDTFDISIFDSKEIKLIDRALEDVKICDPAIGSGAFPMGLLHEIYNLKLPIEDNYGNKAKSPAAIKKHIIEESIYGVDIDNGAVDIARLRFWLSLVVEETEPQPLPNLDFKIICANTLIPSGYDKFLQLAEQTQTPTLLRMDGEIQKLQTIRDNYFKQGIKSKKDSLKNEFINTRDYILNEFKSLKRRWGLGDFIEKIGEWEPFEDKSCTWFDAWWMFGVKDGFDIVIGNPPYVNIANIKDELYRTSLKENFKVSKNKSDLYSFFFEKVKKILKEKGILSYIVSNSWLGTDSFSLLRQYFIDETKLLYLVKCNNDVFDAQVTPIIVSFQNKIVNENTIKLIRYSNNEFSVIGETTYKEIKQRVAYGFSFNTSNISIKAKNGILSDYVKFSLGVKTSDDNRFISDKLKDDDSYKLLRGKDIFRFGYSYSEKWIWYKPNLMLERKGAGVRCKEVFN
ncbi:MAG: N-6 DNA methylase, partial [Saprospiraceae bacterium]